MSNPAFDLNRKISHADVTRIVSEELPHWKAACERSDSDVVVLNQRAFGTSDRQLFLLSVAIKYAGLLKKTMMISP